jgi:hypothetical protein
MSKKKYRESSAFGEQGVNIRMVVRYEKKLEQIHCLKLTDNIERVLEVWFYKCGKLHRTDGPANVIYYDNGNVRFEIWCIDGLGHRINEAAMVIYREDGTILEKRWYRYDKMIKKKQYIVI